MYCVFDLEVFKYDWVIVFKNIETKERFIFHNNSQGVIDFLSQNDPYLFGFNNKWYDNHILKLIVSESDNVTIKSVSDYLINGGMYWQHELLNELRHIQFKTCDLFDDTYRQLSLKAIEAHLGMDIEETQVDFDIDRALSKEELKLTIKYCSHDVDATERVYELRQGYLDTKKFIGNLVGLTPEDSMGLNNSKLLAKFFNAKGLKFDDERDYVFPENINYDYVPKEVVSFFEQIHDKSIPDDVLFSSKIKTMIAECETIFGWGGLHGSKKNYREVATTTRVIQNRDVMSMYPSLMILYNYLSRNFGSPAFYIELYDTRIEAKKHPENKELVEISTYYKFPLNMSFGLTGAKHTALYDPKNARSICITGQLLLTSLAMEIFESTQTVKILNLNTDGIMYSIDKKEIPIVDDICADWEKSSKLTLEVDDIEQVWIKDVNNLVFRQTNGKVKQIGGYLTHGFGKSSAWNVNNNLVAVKKALVEYFLNGIPVEDSINKNDNIFEFQMIAKSSGKYGDNFQLIGDTKVPVQKVNRVYASKLPENGTLYKVHKKTLTANKIPALPENCLVDNANTATIKDIDKNWYIEYAKRQINDYKGVSIKSKNIKSCIKNINNLIGV